MYRIIYLDRIDSTQEEAKRLYKDGRLTEGTVIWAREQTSGRGRHGRIWYSPRGSGIWFTYAFKTKLRDKELNLLSLAAALGVVSTIDKMGLNAFVKWPNDIVVSGRKVCGILLEALFDGERLDFCLLGVGLNLRDVPEAPESTSLERELGFAVDEERVFRELISNIDNSIKRLERDREGVLSLYRELCVTLGKEISFKREGKSLRGKAIGLNEYGGLIVDLNGRIDVLYSETVEGVR